jgi:hypothetical protein
MFPFLALLAFVLFVIAAVMFWGKGQHDAAVASAGLAALALNDGAVWFGNRRGPVA